MDIKRWILITDGQIGSLVQITPVEGGLFHTDCLYEFQSSLPKSVAAMDGPRVDSTDSIKKVTRYADELLVWIEQMNDRFQFSRLDVFAPVQSLEALRNRRPLKLSLIMHEHCLKLTTIALSHPEVQNLISRLIQ